MLDKMAKIVGFNQPEATQDATIPTAELPIVGTPEEFSRRRQLVAESLAAEDSRELAEAVASLTPAERVRFHQRESGRRAAGEPEVGIGWRALIDVRIECGHWPEPRK